MLTSRSETEKIRTLIISDQSLVLAELQNFLGLSPDITLLGELSERNRTATELARTLRPDVLLLDGTASGGEFLATLTELKAECPQLPLILLASQDSKTYVLQAFKAGAAGYVLSMSGEVHIATAIREVHAGHLYLCPRARRLFLDLTHQPIPSVSSPGHEEQKKGRKILPPNKGKTA